MNCTSVVQFLIMFYLIPVSSEDSEDSDFQESGVSEEVSESEDEQRPRTR